MRNLPDPIALDLNFDLDFSIPDFGVASTKTTELEAFESAWRDYWIRFVRSVCLPQLPKSKMGGEDDGNKVFKRTGIHRSDDCWPEGLVRLAKAVPVPSSFTPSDEALRQGIVDNFPPLNDPIPAASFLWKLDRDWKQCDAGPFASAYGVADLGWGETEYGKVLTFELQRLEVCEGSLRSRGLARITFWGKTLLFPLAVAAFSPPVTSGLTEFNARQKIEEQLATQHVLCKVDGEFSYNRVHLIKLLKNRMTHRETGVCEIQAALSALGFSTGMIDGKFGPQTKASAKAFANRWLLPNDSIKDPVFYDTLARALTGEQPPK